MPGCAAFPRLDHSQRLRQAAAEAAGMAGAAGTSGHSAVTGYSFGGLTSIPGMVQADSWHSNWFCTIPGMLGMPPIKLPAIAKGLVKKSFPGFAWHAPAQRVDPSCDRKGAGLALAKLPSLTVGDRRRKLFFDKIIGSARSKPIVAAVCNRRWLQNGAGRQRWEFAGCVDPCG